VRLPQPLFDVQSVLEPHPHMPKPSQTGPGVQVPEQSLQTPWLPHAAFVFPGWHVPPVASLQQPVLQGSVMLQLVPHTPPTQAWPIGQSPEPTHGPHDPPAQCGSEVGHETHVAPVDPHASSLVPPAQVVPSQQPVLHGESSPPPQVFEHVPLVVSHAFCVLQSVSISQPQVPPGRHAEPFLPVHTVHAVPPVPQAAPASPGWQVPPPQQPPLQGDVPLQLVVQLPPLHA
jgi:hypothetical protein